MSNILLTASSGQILGPRAKFLGWIMNYIYEGVDLVLNTDQVAWSIIIFTIIVYTLLLPLTIKQQKFTRISATMNPEIQAIQKKYKGKSDQASMLKQQDEMKLVYQKCVLCCIVNMRRL